MGGAEEMEKSWALKVEENEANFEGKMVFLGEIEPYWYII